MNIFGAMQTAVSGLRAQAYSLENISGNIANSQTTGFKRVDTSFVDLIPEQPYRNELSGSVRANSRLTNTLQGNLQTTGVATNMALSGAGFFVVAQRSGTANNEPTFEPGNLFTRRGDFTVDKSGYLVNGAGHYLKGSSIDPVTGEALGNNGLIQVSTAALQAQRTSKITYNANLPVTPATSSRDASRPGSELLVQPAPADAFSQDPTTTGTNAVIKDDQSLFTARSISGGSITAYDSQGTAASVQLRWAKVQNGDPSASPATEDRWNLFYQSNTNPSAGTDTAWTNVGVPITFDANGKMTSPSPGTINIPNLTVDGRLVGDVAVEFGNTGLTQYAAANGLVEANSIQQNGYPSATLDSLSVGNDGRVAGHYSNGQVIALAQVAVAQFNAPNALKRLDGGVYQQTLESGLPLIGTGGATVLGGSVEGSNTDIADEFSKMIVTQQAYSANTRVITTSQQMLSDVLNVVR